MSTSPLKYKVSFVVDNITAIEKRTNLEIENLISKESAEIKDIKFQISGTRVYVMIYYVS